jgi:hypothetical protein
MKATTILCLVILNEPNRLSAVSVISISLPNYLFGIKWYIYIGKVK